MKTSINTVNGTSKLIYGGLTLEVLSEQDLQRISAEIWGTLMDRAIAKGEICNMCGSSSDGRTVCRDCEIGCEMTDYEYDKMAEVM